MITVAPTESETLSQAMNRLREDGFTANLQFKDGKMVDQNSGKSYSADELTVIGFERFEGATNPADNSILYAIEAMDGTKGSYVSAYGAYDENDAAEFIRKVSMLEGDDRIEGQEQIEG
ncbi:MAG: phosphoribosylpyrophosphate synthetase [Bacteroidota bacterium]